MNSALSAIVASSVASYSKPDQNTTRVVETSSGKIRAKRTAKVVEPKPSAKPAAPSCNGASSVFNGATAASEEPVKVALPVPEIGSLGAHGFITMMRKAKDRGEKILAMQAFCGYDLAGDYGSQELAAMMQSRRTLRPIDASGPSLSEVKSAQRSALGFVGGMPDNMKKQVQDLLAREKMTTETMGEHIKLAREEAAPEDRKIQAGLAALEKARLNQIQGEIRAMVGEDYKSAAPFGAKSKAAHLCEDGVMHTFEKPKPAKDPAAKNWGSFFKG